MLVAGKNGGNLGTGDRMIGENVSLPLLVMTNARVKKISSGVSHSMLLTDNSELMCCGKSVLKAKKKLLLGIFAHKCLEGMIKVKTACKTFRHI